MARAGTIPRQRMPEQDPQVRVRNFWEVPLGYTPELAVMEAERCLQCKNPQCVKGCPVEVDIPGFIRLIREGDFLGAARKIKETNNLPAICGRVCPQETQCEKFCVLGRRYEPVAIGRLERFAADYEREHGYDPPSLPSPTGKKVAVVGSGPSGLTAAADLAKIGHKVVIFEGLHVPGGVLVYGIPEFRLPKSIVQAEVDFVRSLGVEIRTDWVIGKIRTVDELLEEYDAVYIATGAGAPTFMNIPGENLNGVYSANEYLTRVNLMKAYQFPEADTPVRRGRRVVVVGGGNVAMDAARTARRLGADVTVIYRRSRAEMPARLEEVHHAEEEGVKFQFLTNPVRYIGNDEGWVVAAECVRMELGEPDSSGRRRPVPVPGSEFTIEVDQVIVAIGTHANPLVPSTTRDLKLNERGYIVVDPETGATSREGVFAGGDIVTGAATVIEAMGAGKRAARAIDAYLRGRGAERL
ncbi:MAG TPA: NADPH-dependent glutamate synthase [Candidatus Latescibacteria bacterium]|nr:NADPH-dependent glutamate synthase [Candidatus Latescibacterota bacterium]